MAFGSSVESVLDKVISLPSYGERATNYFVKAGRMFESQFESSSEYEAALKASFALAELGLLDHEEPTFVEVTDAVTRNSCRYAVIQKPNKLPHVSVFDMEVFTTDVASRTTERDGSDNSAGLFERVAAVDLRDGSLIEDTLKTYFGFEEFRPLQKETIQSVIKKPKVD